MRIFIVDDEIMIIELLLHLIDWESMGHEIVGTALDGKKALESIKALEPDVVITDIRMPGMNGLDIIQKTQALGIDTSFVIISGHNNFEYAQTAIRFGVKDYLLKPINKADLLKIISGLEEELGSRQRSQIEAREKSDKYNIAKIQVHKRLIESVVSGALDMNLPLDMLNAEFLLELKPGIFQFVILKFDSRGTGEGSALPPQLFELAIRYIGKWLRPLCHELVIDALQTEIHLALNYDKARANELQQGLQSVLDEMEDDCKNYFGVHFTICKGSAETEFPGLLESCRSSIRSLRQRIMMRLNTIIEPPPLFDVDEVLKQLVSKEACMDIARSIEKFDVANLKAQINRLFAYAEAVAGEWAEVYYALSMHIYALFLDITQNLNLIKNRAQELDDLRRQLDDCIDVPFMRHVLFDRIAGHIDEYVSSEDNSSNKYVSIVKKYIAEHYMEKITLDYVARLVYLNPVYFSILFKQETGVNFVDYLNNYRIEVSKKSLKNIGPSLSEVASLSGFANTKYFAKIFKRIVGITPSQYRDKYLRHSSQ